MKITFDRFYFIQSLPKNERQTGLNIYEDSRLVAKASGVNLDISFHQINSAQEFFNLLINIEGNVNQENIRPLIHIDCHGSEDGLQFSNGDFLDWENIREHFIRINRACCLNLVIVVSACEGISSIKTMNKMDYCPFALLISAEGKQFPKDLEEDFTKFYQELFRTSKFKNAYNLLNQKRRYIGLDAKRLFSNTYLQYYEVYCTGKGKQARKERLLSELKNKTPYQSVNQLRKIIKDLLTENNEKQILEDMIKRYFYIDMYPEIEQRFSLSYDEILY